MSALSTANALKGPGDVEQQTPALPGGADPSDIQPIMGAGGIGGIPNLPANIPTLEGPVKATVLAGAVALPEALLVLSVSLLELPYPALLLALLAAAGLLD